MPNPELKEWVSLVKDSLLGLAAIVTIFVGVYGVWAWKRDLVGKEVFGAAKQLVKQSHLMQRAALNLRQPICPSEKRQFTDEEIKCLTENERWRISEAEAFKLKIDKFREDIKGYIDAKLELRVLIGSKVYEGFLPFDRYISVAISNVNTYLDLLVDYSCIHFADSPEIIEAQQQLYPSENLDDELSQNLADSREVGEEKLLSYLHRKSIYG